MNLRFVNCFQLDPDSTVARGRAGAGPSDLPGKGGTIARGMIGFGLPSLIVYGMWAGAGRWFYTNLGEAGFYAVCAMVFIALCGFLLRYAVIAPPAPARFYSFFAVAFFSYALAWCVAWFAWRGRAGEWAGSFAGTLALALVFTRAFQAREKLWPVFAMLFLLHSAGYFAGGWLYEWSKTPAAAEMLSGLMDRAGRAILGKLLWGGAYGIGLGAGLGYAFYACQEKVRTRIAKKDRQREAESL